MTFDATNVYKEYKLNTDISGSHYLPTNFTQFLIFAMLHLAQDVLLFPFSMMSPMLRNTITDSTVTTVTVSGSLCWHFIVYTHKFAGLVLISRQ